ETGRPCLFLGRRRNSYIVGMELDESEALLDELWAHATQAQFTFCQEWRVGDVLIWDNRCTLHRRDSFDPNARRLMHRTQIKADRLRAREPAPMNTQIARRPIPDTQLRLSIERVEVFGVAVPLVAGGFKNAYLTKTVQKSAIVRVTAAGGAIGLGNIDPSPGYSTETVEESLGALRDKLSPCVIALDASHIHALNSRLDATLDGFLDAKAAIEMACVDLTARALGIPVYTYLGGAAKERLTFNAWIGIVPPDEAAAEAKKWVGRGFRSAKIKVGGGIEADRDRVKAVREAVGEAVALRIDANAGYDAETAIR